MRTLGMNFMNGVRFMRFRGIVMLGHGSSFLRTGLDVVGLGKDVPSSWLVAPLRMEILELKPVTKGRPSEEGQTLLVVSLLPTWWYPALPLRHRGKR